MTAKVTATTANETAATAKDGMLVVRRSSIPDED
jgi:hypothetical protein